MRALGMLAAAALLVQPLVATEPAHLIRDIVPGPEGSRPVRLADLSGTVLFTIGEPFIETELWRSDGTTDGTARFAFVDRAFVGRFAPWGGKLFFTQYDYIDYIEPDMLPRPWVTDGTLAGTQRLSNAEAYFFVPLDDTVLFLGRTPGAGLEPWRTDGSATGTTLVREVAPGIQPWDPSGAQLGRFGDRALLWVWNSTGGALWTSDGSVDGTTLVDPTDGCHYANGFVGAGALTYFFCGNTSLWTTDGTSAGTFPRPLPHPAGSTTPLGTSLYLVLRDEADGDSVWKTREDAPLVDLVYDGIGSGAHRALFLGAGGSTLYLSGHDADHGQELWGSDGTQTGTGLLRDIAPGAASSDPVALAHLDGGLLFAAWDGSHGVEPWRSDGTPEGTRLLRDVAPGVGGSGPQALGTIDGVLLFAAFDADHGRELWRTDGTEEGTVRIQDIAAGPSSSDPGEVVAAGPRIFFSADDQLHGAELWAGWRGILTGKPQRALTDLRTEVQALDLRAGLLARIDAAAAALERGDTSGASRRLELIERTLSALGAHSLAELAAQTRDLIGGASPARGRAR